MTRRSARCRWTSFCSTATATRTTTDDQLRIEGSYQGSITYDLTVDIDWGAIDHLPDAVATCIASLVKIVIGKKPSCAIDDLIPEVKVTFKVDPGVASELHLVGQASLGFEKDFDVAVDATLHSPIVPLGPLVFHAAARGHREGRRQRERVLHSRGRRAHDARELGQRLVEDRGHTDVLAADDQGQRLHRRSARGRPPRACAGERWRAPRDAALWHGRTVRDRRGDARAPSGCVEDAVLGASRGARERHRRLDHDAGASVPRPRHARQLEHARRSRRSTTSSRAAIAPTRRPASRIFRREAGRMRPRCGIPRSRRGRMSRKRPLSDTDESGGRRITGRGVLRSSSARSTIAGSSRAATRARS